MASLKLPKGDPTGTARAILTTAGFDVLDERPIEHAVQFLLGNGAVLNVYGSGTVLPQGSNSEAVRAVFAKAIEDVLHTGPSPQPPSRTQRKSGSLKLLQVAPEKAPIVGSSGRLHPEWTTEPWDGVSAPFKL